MTRSSPNWPEDYPVAFAKARELVNGKLGHFYIELLRKSIAPLFWFQPRDIPSRILHGGTVTIVRTKSRLFGITAAHVVEQYLNDVASLSLLGIQIGNKRLPDLKIIDSSQRRDLATCEITWGGPLS